MQTHQRSRTLFRQSKVVNFVGRISLVAAFGIPCVIALLGNAPAVADAHGRSNCSDRDHARLNTSSHILVYPNAHAASSLIAMRAAGSFHKQQDTCIVARSLTTDVRSNGSQDARTSAVERHTNRVSGSKQLSQRAQGHNKVVLTHSTAAPVLLSATINSAEVGTQNLFPYGQCTWWANQRYHQVHGVYVGWQNNANAWQWTARARQAGWSVSAAPQVGDIMVLQPRVQGASSLGHVAFVEHVLSGGRVIASSMNWGIHRGSVSDFQFSAGPGVAFLHQ